MSNIVTEPIYSVLQSGDPGYDILRSHFPDIAGSPSFTAVTGRLPRAVTLTEGNFLVARYCLDTAVNGQDCLATPDHRADADIFFDADSHRISGLERIHALAHLVLACVGDYTDELHVTDRGFTDSEDNFWLVFSAEIDIPWLHCLINQLWSDLNALLQGRIEGVIAQFAFPAV